jgi:hypothetical protein
MYTISEFRKNTRKAFNDADSGHEVVIERYGQKYQLVSLVDKPHKGHVFESTPTDVVLKTSPEKPENLNLDNAPQKSVEYKYHSPKKDGTFPKLKNSFCKTHSTPLDSRGKCLQKGCKYA